MLQPKALNYRKPFKSSLNRTKAPNKPFVYANLCLISLEAGFISSKNLEASRQAIQRKIKRKGKLWFRIFPQRVITKKPVEQRMGKGKGPVSHYASKVSPGTVLFELGGVMLTKGQSAFKTGSAKLPVKTKILFRRHPHF